MAIRHFRRKEIPEDVSSSSDESSCEDQRVGEVQSVSRATGEEETIHKSASLELELSDDEEPLEKVVEPENVAAGANIESKDKKPAAENENTESEHTASSDESSDTSSSEDDYALHKPVFLKRTKKSGLTEDLRKRNSTGGQEAHTAVASRVREEGERAKKAEELAAVAACNFSADQDLLKDIMTLDDNDDKDPEAERAQWEERQKIRAVRWRQILEEKQRELEDREYAKLASGLNTDNFAKSYSISQERILDDPRKQNQESINISAQSSKPLPLVGDSGKRKLKTRESRGEKHKRYNPQSLNKKDIILRSAHPREVEDAENEYSVI
ncbi:LANO_0C04478g1_1 [Lachancea nothofagi CBS 11611]|uniref:LANO_0C04478g1_1 n=1 Tax=Lachancea nothofagi CBS 11611 TaxID=1266666 RepID=A0A1G4J6N8_9SACH|nr:LANO_0C04478g1_1 [Lachancea nothofagi CBS 11611]